ncbi:MAG: choice-of-anchor D domain-containing protein [Proteobacteria bacterium]|nr:choice-of-anchor D domain-containing protein [Pseudomonadota bacterium]
MAPTRHLGILAAVSLLAATGCNEQELRTLTPDFHIEWPEDFGYAADDFEASALLFGSVETGTVVDIPVLISNPGTANLEICTSYLAVATFDENGELASEAISTNNPEIAWSGPSEPMDLDNGVTMASVLLRFTPLYGTPLEDNLYLVVKHELNYNCEEDFGSGLYIPITGEGDGEPVPDIISKPTVVEFADQTVGGLSAVHDVRISNVGPGQLDVGGIYLADDTHFVLVSDSVSGVELQQGESALLSVQYAPGSEGNHDTFIMVPSNDPDEDLLEVLLTGTADPVSTGKGPQAVCAPDFDSAPFETESFDGSDSFDPDGLDLTFQWVMTPPSGSTSTLSSYNVAEPSVTLDLAGDYTGTLTITNTAGQSDNCTQVISAIPNENFRIEMFWQTSGDDMDLHLLEANDGSGNGGTPRTDGDCYYGNCNTSWSTPPNWGDPGTNADDPGLDLDDISGTGPENINIGDPAMSPYDGWYEVFVHDYPGSSYTPANDVTVNIYLDGILAQTYNFAISGEDSDYYVAKIHWPTGNVQACNGISGCP